MPKTSNEGPSYAGLVDVSPPETATPEWVVLTDDEPAEPGDVSRETEPAKQDDADDKPGTRKSAPRRTSK